jgi:hypothetical protein
VSSTEDAISEIKRKSPNLIETPNRAKLIYSNSKNVENAENSSDEDILPTIKRPKRACIESDEEGDEDDQRKEPQKTFDNLNVNPSESSQSPPSPDNEENAVKVSNVGSEIVDLCEDSDAESDVIILDSE